jgi:putative membrane protein
MKIVSAVAIVALFAAAPAFAQVSTTEKTGLNAVVGAAPSTADFVTEVAISDMFEIQSSELAGQKSDAATKTFAGQMVTDHKKTSGELKALIQTAKLNVTPPPTLDASHQKMLDKLKSESGEAFTKDYHSDQVSAHKAAVSLFERYGKNGDNPALKDWANKTLPALQHHLEMAQALDK